ncbi:MAG: hypothetical protein ACEQSB_07400, partial [Undibacterium sp.]
MESNASDTPLPKLSLREKLSFISSRHRSRPGRLIAAILGGLLLVCAISVSALYASITAGIPDVSSLDHYDPAETTKIFA